MTTNPYKELHQQMIQAGWTHRVDGRGHHQYRPPQELKAFKIKYVAWPSTPGRGRSAANTLAKVKRALAATEEARANV